MSITEEVAFDKDGKIERFSLFRKLFLSITIILVAGLSFGIGRLSVVGKREPIQIEYDASISNSQFPISNEASVSQAVSNIENSLKTENSKIENSAPVVVSKNGTRYHYLHCGGAKQIKEENKIIFPTAHAAESAGYTLAANCKPK